MRVEEWGKLGGVGVMDNRNKRAINYCGFDGARYIAARDEGAEGEGAEISLSLPSLSGTSC